MTTAIDQRSHGRADSEDQLNDVPESEIESNWDQVVDKYVAFGPRSVSQLLIRIS